MCGEGLDGQRTDLDLGEGRPAAEVLESNLELNYLGAIRLLFEVIVVGN